MEITRKKLYKHYTYARKQVVPVVELESLIDKSVQDRDEQAERMAHILMSRIDFEKLGRVSRILAMESDRQVLSSMELQKIVYEIILDALDKFLINRDVAFYDSEFLAVCIFVGKNGRHGLVIYPKLDLPK